MKTNILILDGHPIIGGAGSMTRAQREDWLQNVRSRGQAAA